VAVETDLTVFFDADDFAIAVTRVRPAVADVQFLALLGVTDDDALLGRATAAARQLHWATGPDVREGDTITVAVTGPMAVHNGSYRVLEPRRVNDGAESACFLQKIAA
jgi:hypothetical protein